MYGDINLMRNASCITVYKFCRATALILWEPKELLENIIADTIAAQAQAKKTWFTSEEDLAKIEILKGNNDYFR